MMCVVPAARKLAGWYAGAEDLGVVWNVTWPCPWIAFAEALM